MEIRVYSRSLSFLGVVDDFTSLMWTRRYYEPGVVEVHAPLTAHNLELLQPENIIMKQGDDEAAILEARDDESGPLNNEIIRTGHFIPIFLDRRIIPKTINYSGAVEAAMYQLIRSVHAIPGLLVAPYKGLIGNVEFQVSYKNLCTYETKLAKAAGFGFKTTVNIKRKNYTFEVFAGKDRTKGQSTNKRVVFRDKNKNINSANYTYDNTKLRTYALVGGEGEGSERKFVTIDLGGTGLDRREIFIDAKDIKSDDLQTIVDDAYEAAAAAKTSEEEILKSVNEAQSAANTIYSKYQEAQAEASHAEEEAQDYYSQAQNEINKFYVANNQITESRRRADKLMEESDKLRKKAQQTKDPEERDRLLRQSEECRAMAEVETRKVEEYQDQANQLYSEYDREINQYRSMKDEADSIKKNSERLYIEYLDAAKRLDNLKAAYAEAQAYTKAAYAQAQAIQQKEAAEYLNLLRERGIEKLAENIVNEALESEVDTGVDYIYKKDYDLGDLVTVESDKFGVEIDLRITEIEEIYEFGAFKISLTFGDALPESIDLSED